MAITIYFSRGLAYRYSLHILSFYSFYLPNAIFYCKRTMHRLSYKAFIKHMYKYITQLYKTTLADNY